jgi:hypothetical protein
MVETLEITEALASKPKPPPPRDSELGKCLHPIQKDRFSKPFFGAIIVGVGALGAVVLYGTTGWLWLVVHEGLH